MKTEQQQFYGNFLNQSFSAGFQALLFSSLTFVDIYLSGQLGNHEIAAAGIAGRTFWLVSMVLFGVGSGAGVFFAQYFGKKDLPGFRNIFQVSVFINLSIAIPCSVFFLTCSTWIMSLITNDQQVVLLGAQYLQVISVSLILAAAFLASDYLYRSINRPNIPLIAGMFEVAANIIVSSMLVFGWFGITPLGLLGAAWGSVIARGLRVLFLLIHLFYFEKTIKVLTINWLILPKYSALFLYLDKALPLMFNSLIWAVGIYLYSLLFAKLGVTELAIWNTILPLQSMSFAFLTGIASAASMLVGHSLGAKHFNQAYQRAWFSTLSAIGLGFFIALVVYFLKGFYAQSFTGLNADIQQQINNVLIIPIIMLPINAISLVLLVGVFRAGGSTRFNLAIDVITAWGIALPIAWVGAFYWQWDIFYILMALLGAEVIKASTCIWFLFSKRWVNRLAV